MEEPAKPPGRDLETRLFHANRLFQTAVMLIYGKRKSVDKAIKCIQRAIVLEEENYKYWQLLGEAYYQRGSLNPSISCFMKSLTLADEFAKKLNETTNQSTEMTRLKADSTYSQLRMSDIRLSVQQLDEAMSGYDDIINSDPTNVAALVGMSKVELLTARNAFHNGLVKSGHSHCMSALEFSLRATKLSPYLCHTWKLASDCCLIQFLYGQRGNFSATINTSEFPGDNQRNLVITRSNCAKLAQQFLCKALSIESYENSSCLWHNLGLSLYLQSTLVDQSHLKERHSLLTKALKCLLKALDFDRTNSQVRNSIGIVSYLLNYITTSQNCLIRSIQTNMSTSETQFSNLGYIFLQRGEFKLATVAFNRCQAEEPLYCRSWFGNALLSEQRNLENMPFLRHCYKLENNYESQMKYATKVVSLPHSEQHHKDLINATDCMERILNYDEQSSIAQNTLGLLLERLNFKARATKCFNEARRHEANDSRVIFNQLRQYSSMNSGCMLDPNLADSIDSDLLKLTEKLSVDGNLYYMLNFIHYLFSNFDYDKIETRMTKVIAKLPRHDLKSRISAGILIAMSKKATGLDYQGHLFQNMVDCNGVVCLELMINQLCLMLFGSVENEESLVDQITNELSKIIISYISLKSVQFKDLFYSLEGLWLRLLLVSSIFCHSNQSKILRLMVALYPTIAELWLFLGISYMFKKQQYHTAIFCIRKANLIGSTNENLNVICNILLAVLVSNSGIKQSKNSVSVDPTRRINYLSQALYNCPNYGLLWECLTSRTDKVPKFTLKKNQTITGKDAELFQLAIDHTIKMISV